MTNETKKTTPELETNAPVSIKIQNTNTPKTIKKSIISNLKYIYDPEIPVNIWELGLIYNVTIHKNQKINVIMTLTSPIYPTTQKLINQIKITTKKTPYITKTIINLI